MINEKSYDLKQEYKKVITDFHEISKFPIKISELASKFNVPTYGDDLPQGISGQIVKDGDGYYISVNINENRRRRRFTAAHELAHFLLHQDKIGDGVVDNVMYRSTLSDSVEVEANKLAADILMPMSKISEQLQLGNNSIQMLSNYFDVSEQAMKVRLGIPI